MTVKEAARLSRKSAMSRPIASLSHPDRSNGLCVMEMVAWVAGEKHSDAPDCVCPVIRKVAIKINDSIKDDAVRTKVLRPFLFRLMGTRATPDVEWKRAFKAVDLAVRHFAPLALEIAKRKDLADRLRAISPIVDKATANASLTETQAVRAAAAADAYAAAAADAYAAAAAAAYAAAYAAAAAAAAAYAAAAYAAYAAAYAAAAAAAAAYAAADAYARSAFWAKEGPMFLEALLAIK